MKHEINCNATVHYSSLRSYCNTILFQIFQTLNTAAQFVNFSQTYFQVWNGTIRPSIRPSMEFYFRDKCSAKCVLPKNKWYIDDPCSNSSHFQILPRHWTVELLMSGKAGELIPTYQRKISPSSPSSGPSRPTSPTWVARVPTAEGLARMKKCQDIVQKMRASSKAERSSKFTKTVVGVSGTWLVCHLAAEEQWRLQQRWWVKLIQQILS